MAHEYIEQCVDIMQRIKSDGLELYPKVTHDDLSGSTKLASIGRVNLGARILPVCVKYQPLWGTMSVQNRMPQELNPASMLFDKVPALRKRLPIFFGQISVGGRIVATITEDVTANGVNEIWSTPVADDDIVLLKEAFPESEKSGPAFTTSSLQDVLAFTVNGTQRWLDFTPGPFEEAYIRHNNHRDAVHEHIEQLTWAIPSLLQLGIRDARVS